MPAPRPAEDSRRTSSLYLPPAAAGLARLPEAGCRWPLGEPADETFRFCGAARLRPSAYCACHAARARRCR